MSQDPKLSWNGVVKAYDSTTASGRVLVGDVLVWFPITSFFNDPPNTPPKVGQVVEVVFQTASPSQVLAVLACSGS